MTGCCVKSHRYQMPDGPLCFEETSFPSITLMLPSLHNFLKLCLGLFSLCSLWRKHHQCLMTHLLIPSSLSLSPCPRPRNSISWVNSLIHIGCLDGKDDLLLISRSLKGRHSFSLYSKSGCPWLDGGTNISLMLLLSTQTK